MTLRQAAEKAVRVLRDAGHTALFAGGCVRDMLLGAAPKDIDIATDAPPERVMALFRRTRAVGAKFGVVMTHIGRHEFEIATFRTESDYADHRRPDNVTFSSPDEDAKRRDFTINGMFYDPLADEVIDYVGGRADVEARLVRAIGDPDERLEEDHLRMLRAVRFAARLEFAIEAETYAAVRRHADRIRTISAERTRLEIEQILTHPTRRRGWELIHESGLSGHLVDGVTWSDAEAAAIARRLEALPDEVWFPTTLAVLFAKLKDREVSPACHRLRLGNRETETMRWLRGQLPRALRAAELELADVKLLAANGAYAELLKLVRAELRAEEQPLESYTLLQRRALAIRPADVSPPPLLTGDDLLAMDVPQGPTYARVLAAVYRAQLNEAVLDRGAALALARVLLEA